MRRCHICTRWPLSAALFGILLLAACGPIQYLANTPFAATPTIFEAQRVNADKYAPYEMTAAREYLHKARELAGYARFQDSIECARKSTKYAGEARFLSVERMELADKSTPTSGPASAGDVNADKAQP